MSTHIPSVVFVALLFCHFQEAIPSTISNSQKLCFHWLINDQQGNSLQNACLGGHSAILFNGVWATYTIYYAGTERTYSERFWIEYNEQPPGLIQQEGTCLLTVTKVEYNFTQPEHGGGDCQCLNITLSQDCQRNNSVYASLCGGSASYPRTAAFVWYPDSDNTRNREVSAQEVVKMKPFNTSCNNSTNTLHIEFDLFTKGGYYCDPLKNFDEGIEFSVRFASFFDEWIPVTYVYLRDTYGVSLQEDDMTILLRGYVADVLGLQSQFRRRVSVQICDFPVSDSFQFRWLQTSNFYLPYEIARHVWTLDNVKAWVHSTHKSCHLFEDSFSTGLNSQIWDSNIRNGRISSKCSWQTSLAIVFGLDSFDDNFDRNRYELTTSRSVLTKEFSLCHTSCFRGLKCSELITAIPASSRPSDLICNETEITISPTLLLSEDLFNSSMGMASTLILASIRTASVERKTITSLEKPVILVTSVSELVGATTAAEEMMHIETVTTKMIDIEATPTTPAVALTTYAVESSIMTDAFRSSSVTDLIRPSSALELITEVITSATEVKEQSTFTAEIGVMPSQSVGVDGIFTTKEIQSVEMRKTERVEEVLSTVKSEDDLVTATEVIDIALFSTRIEDETTFTTQTNAFITATEVETVLIDTTVTETDVISTVANEESIFTTKADLDLTTSTGGALRVKTASTPGMEEFIKSTLATRTILQSTAGLRDYMTTNSDGIEVDVILTLDVAASQYTIGRTTVEFDTTRISAFIAATEVEAITKHTKVTEIEAVYTTKVEESKSSTKSDIDIATPTTDDSIGTITSTPVIIDVIKSTFAAQTSLKSTAGLGDVHVTTEMDYLLTEIEVPFSTDITASNLPVVRTAAELDSAIINPTSTLATGYQGTSLIESELELLSTSGFEFTFTRQPILATSIGANSNKLAPTVREVRRMDSSSGGLVLEQITTEHLLITPTPEILTDTVATRTATPTTKESLAVSTAEKLPETLTTAELVFPTLEVGEKGSPTVETILSTPTYKIIDKSMSLVETKTLQSSIKDIMPTYASSRGEETTVTNEITSLLSSTVGAVLDILPVTTPTPMTSASEVYEVTPTTQFRDPFSSIIDVVIEVRPSTGVDILDLTKSAEDGKKKGTTVDQVTPTASGDLLMLLPTTSLLIPRPSPVITGPIEELLCSLVPLTLTRSLFDPSLPSIVMDERIIEKEEDIIKLKILCHEDLMIIEETKGIDEKLDLLLNLSKAHLTDAPVLVYLLKEVVDNFTSFDNASKVIEISSIILESYQTASLSDEERVIVGTTLLFSLDEMALSAKPGIYNSNSIVVEINEEDILTTDQYFNVFNTENYENSSFPLVTTDLPTSLLNMFATNEKQLRVVSTFYGDIDYFFPTAPEFELVSDIVGTSLLCGMDVCPTNNLNLSSPVQIYFEHSTDLVEIWQKGTHEIVCAFLDFPIRSTLLNFGHWETRGCQRNEELSSVMETVCECTHLTHFALFLRPLSTQTDTIIPTCLRVLSLNGIDYFLISVGLLSLALTVIILIAIRALFDDGNFIHVNLCVNLAIAQTIYVVGIDRSDLYSSVVPTHCQVIAVLLHYFFLVSFMWMLMEGSFLITILLLNRKQMKLCLFFFTLISYGLPLLYVGLVTVPLGFVLSSIPVYGFCYACFLTADSWFIWTFMAPVIVIFAIAAASVLVAAFIWCHHRNKLQNKLVLLPIPFCWAIFTLILVFIMAATVVSLLTMVILERAELVYLHSAMIFVEDIYIFVDVIILSRVMHGICINCCKTKQSKSKSMDMSFSDSETSNTKEFLIIPNIYWNSREAIQNNSALRVPCKIANTDPHNSTPKIPLLIPTSSGAEGDIDSSVGMDGDNQSIKLHWNYT